MTVVHPAGHLMERQLDPTAGAVLARVLARLGIEVRVGATVERYVPGRGLALAGGDLVRADWVWCRPVCARRSGWRSGRGW